MTASIEDIPPRSDYKMIKKHHLGNQEHSSRKYGIDPSLDAYLFCPILQVEKFQFGFCKMLPSLAFNTLALSWKQVLQFRCS